MGVVIASLALLAAYTAFRAACSGLHRLVYVLYVCQQAVLALGRTAKALSQPPGSTLYSGPPTWWLRTWHLLTLGPLQSLAGPGSFARSYALLVAPALAVAAVALLALAVRSGAVVELLRAAARSWRGLLGVTVCAVALLLADDAVRVYARVGRVFLATLRLSGATLMGAVGLLLLPGPPDSGGVTLSQMLEWLRALSLTAAAATSGVGGGSLILQAIVLKARDSTSATATITTTGNDNDAASAAMAAAAATAAAAAVAVAEQPESLSQTVGRLSFMLYGSVLMLVAFGCAASLSESDVLERVAGSVLRALRLLRLRPLLAAAARAAARAVRMLTAVQLLRAAATALRRADDAVTQLLLRGLRAAAAAGRALRAGLRRLLSELRCLLEELFGGALLRLLQAVAAGLRDGCLAVHRRALLPAARTARAAAQTIHRFVLRPVGRAVWAAARQHVAPVAWPAGSSAVAVCWLREAAAQRSALPFGGAAAVAAVIGGLMAGKALRRSRMQVLSRLGDCLEELAAAAYLNLDLGLGRPVARMLSAAVAAAVLTAQLLAASGRKALALLAGPLAGLLAAAVTAVAWLWERLGRAVYLRVAAAGRACRAVVAAIWSQPELALAAAAAVVAAAYTAHVAQLPAAAARLVAACAAAAATATARCLSWLLTPLLRRVGALAITAAAALGLSSGAWVRGAAAVADCLLGWGRRSSSDLASLFRSGGFASTFLGLNLMHALLLRGWAVPALEAQGVAGRAAVRPVISFVARSTVKAILGPMLLSAASSLLVGGGAVPGPGGGLGGGLGAQLIALTAPALWALYLAGMWLEGVRRVKLSFHPLHNTSEFGLALQAAGSGAAAGAGAAAITDAGHIRWLSHLSLARLLLSRPALGSQPAAAAITAPATARSALGFLPPGGRTATTAASVDPDCLTTPFAARQQQLYSNILAQGPPSYVFPTDTCAVCFEELQLESVAGAAAAAVGAGAAAAARSTEGAGAAAKGLAAAEEVQPLALRCGHGFHRDCVLTWLLRTPRCPVCREPAVGASRHANVLF